MSAQGKYPANEQLKRKCSWKEIPPGGIITRAGSALENKTGSWRSFRPVIDESKCINCSFCISNCPDNAITFINGKRQAVNMDYCKGCGICGSICPVKCIKMVEETKFR
jgi:pyruvate ferredoxin oxidoreductase delta subunit